MVGSGFFFLLSSSLTIIGAEPHGRLGKDMKVESRAWFINSAKHEDKVEVGKQTLGLSISFYLVPLYCAVYELSKKLFRFTEVDCCAQAHAATYPECLLFRLRRDSLDIYVLFIFTFSFFLYFLSYGIGLPSHDDSLNAYEL